MSIVIFREPTPLSNFMMASTSLPSYWFIVLLRVVGTLRTYILKCLLELGPPHYQGNII